MTFPFRLRPRAETCTPSPRVVASVELFQAPGAGADFHPADCPHRRGADPVEALRPCCGGDPLCRAMAEVCAAGED